MSGKKRKVRYGTSNPLPNVGELWLTTVVAKASGVVGVEFFVYPYLLELEKELYEPFFPPRDSEEVLRQSNLKKFAPDISFTIVPIQKLVPENHKMWDTPLEDVVTLVREFREIKSFVVLNDLSTGEVIRASSNDRKYLKIKSISLREIFNNPFWKAGGTLCYFAYGVSAALNQETSLYILPYKRKPDVVNAFRAGVAFVTSHKVVSSFPPNVIRTGEVDIMTYWQWWLWKVLGGWRVPPPWVIARLIENEEIHKEAIRRVLSGEYCALCYNEYDGTFTFVTGQE